MVTAQPASAGDAGDSRPVPGSARPPGGGCSNPPRYSCLENPVDRGAWRAAVHGVTESHKTGVTEQLLLLDTCDP